MASKAAQVKQSSCFLKVKYPDIIREYVNKAIEGVAKLQNHPSTNAFNLRIALYLLAIEEKENQ